MKMRHTILFLFLLGLALGFRFWIIHQAPHSFCISRGRFGSSQVVMPLMAKHILERGEFPLFFYGQNWFGSVEAFVHATFFYFFGMNYTTVHFAPLFFFSVFCTSLFLLAYELFGLGVAFWSLAWCIFSPFRLTEYSLMPHGGYIDAPMFGTLLLWIAVRTGRASSLGRKVLGNIAMGFVGGLGWWASPMMVYYLAATAIFILIKERIGGIARGLIFGIPAFLLGAAPFFYYYLRDSVSRVSGMGSGFSFKNFGNGLVLLFRERLPGFLDFQLHDDFFKGFYWYGVCVYALATVFLFYRFRKDLVNIFRWKSIKGSDTVIILMFALSFVLIAATSVQIRKNATQYLIPLSPYLSISLGYAACHLFRRVRFAAPLMLVLLFLLQLRISVAWVKYEAPLTEGKAQACINGVEEMEKKRLDRVYVWNIPSSEILNYYSKERITCANPVGERYDPYFRILESSQEVAFLNPGALESSISLIGGSYKKEQCGKFRLYSDFNEPERRYRQISIEPVRIETNPVSNLTERMKDRDMNTVWATELTKKKTMWVQFDLGKPYTIGMVRLWNQGLDLMEFAQDVSIEVSRDGSTWNEVVKRAQGDCYYWSGPRIYYWEWGYRWEARFGPVEARWVRIRQYEDSDFTFWKINEAYIYEDFGEGSRAHQGEQDVLRAVKELGLDRIYADRWMSSKVREASGGAVDTVEPFAYLARKLWNNLKSRTVLWGSKTGFILEDSDADSFERMMREQNIVLSRKNFDRWILFYFSRWEEQEEELMNDSSWWWMGLGVVKGYPKNTSEYLRELGQKKVKTGELGEALKCYRKSLKLYPNHTRARREIIDVLKKLGKRDEALSEEKKLLEETEPQRASPVEFKNGAEFLGYTLGKSEIRAGDRVKIDYYWRLGEHPGGELVVFVHVDGNGQLFQGDHAFLKDADLSRVFKDEIFREEEYIFVPKDIPPGKYKIGIGVYKGSAQERWKIRRTSLKVSDRKIFIGELEVVK